MAKTSPLATEATPRGTARSRERLVKNGKNACGHQPFRCGACRVLAPKRRETAPERKEEGRRAVATERLGLRATQHVVGVDRHTISRWLQKSRSAPAAERHAASC